MSNARHIDGAPPVHTGRFFALGIALVLLGSFAFATPFVTTLASVVWYGAVVFAGGVLELLAVFGARRWSGVLMHVLSGIAGVVLGLLLLAHPAAGAAGLTLVVAAMFIVGGIARTIYAVALRFPSWGWSLAGGILTALMGAWIAIIWPVSSLWTIGTIVAVELLSRGWGWLMLAMALRRGATIPGAASGSLSFASGSSTP